MGSRFSLSSGRLIALGRLLLAALLLLAAWLDPNQSAQADSATSMLLAFYIGFAAVVLGATWWNWWLDAKLAGPSHTIDIATFSLLVLTSDSVTSPYVIVFVFLLLVAAIRWSWRATVLIALLLITLHLFAGLLIIGTDAGPERQLLMVRTGQLLVLAMILIWFGANQWRSRYARQDDGLSGQPPLDQSPLEPAARGAMARVRASAATFVWREGDGTEFVGMLVRDGESQDVAVPAQALAAAVEATPFLYDVGKDRCLRKDSNRNLVDCTLSEMIAPQVVAGLGLAEGLAIPIRSERGEGELFLEDVRGLSTDHIDMAERVAEDVATFIRRQALLRAVDENAEARSRLSLARDLHDSVVQFLAGAAFRLEAMKRSQAAGRDVQHDLDELKQLMLHEQGELRVFIAALRSGSQVVAFADLAEDLKALAQRLSRQWDVNCDVTVRRADLAIPTRVQTDAHQLMREAVANAVRHAGAKTIKVKLDAAAEGLRLAIANDGAAMPVRGGRPEMPASLQERVAQAGGELDISRGMGFTRLTIVLPIEAKRR